MPDGDCYPGRYDGVPLGQVLAAEIGSADALPLLQMTLREPFDRRDRPGALLTFAAYRRIGGLTGAIAAGAASDELAVRSGLRASRSLGSALTSTGLAALLAVTNPDCNSNRPHCWPGGSSTAGPVLHTRPGGQHGGTAVSRVGTHRSSP
jgi:hypothetical protein